MSLLADPSRVSAWNSEALTAFDDSRKDIIVVARTPLPGVAEAVARARVRDYRANVTAATALDRVAEALEELTLDCQTLAADLVAIALSFLAQFGAGEATLRVELVDKTSCPKLHCDNVGVRLVTTYHGAGTEYVHADAPEVVCAAPTFALVFLKGHKHPTHADAVLHRSPPMPPGDKRLFVVLDVWATVSKRDLTPSFQGQIGGV